MGALKLSQWYQPDLCHSDGHKHSSGGSSNWDPAWAGSGQWSGFSAAPGLAIQEAIWAPLEALEAEEEQQH